MAKSCKTCIKADVCQYTNCIAHQLLEIKNGVKDTLTHKELVSAVGRATTAVSSNCRYYRGE